LNFDKNKVNKDVFRDAALKRKALADVKLRLEERSAYFQNLNQQSQPFFDANEFYHFVLRFNFFNFFIF
jgi:hypothetical protein